MSQSATESAEETANAIGRFEAFNEAFERAARAAGGIDARSFVVAGKRLRVEFAGPSLAPYLSGALDHLSEAFAADPEIRIRVWDSKSTGVALPSEVGDLSAHIEMGMPGPGGSERILSAFRRPDPGLSMFDRASRRGIYWLQAPGFGGFEDRSTPFRALLSWALLELDVQFVHGACVGASASGRGVLVVGRGGSGKSSTALASLLAGLDYVSDDYCAVTVGQTVVAHSVFSSAKLTADNLVRFSGLRHLLINPGRIEFEKGIVLLNEHFPTQIVPRLRIQAVVAPTVLGEGPTTFEPLSPARALLAIAPSTLLQLSSIREPSLRTLAVIARNVPAFQLRIGAGVGSIPGALLEILNSSTKVSA